MCPGVIIGAQVAARLQGEGKIEKETFELAIGTLFAIAGILFLGLFVKSMS